MTISSGQSLKDYLFKDGSEAEIGQEEAVQTPSIPEPSVEDMVAAVNPIAEPAPAKPLKDYLFNIPSEPTPAAEPDTVEVPELFTAEDIMTASPKADREIVDALVNSQNILHEYGINTSDRVSMFLGQMAHESAGFKALREYAGGSQYEGRADLGNTQPGDGERYKGRGIIQLTGRYNYNKYGKMIGEDLENNPELAADPKIAVKIAAAYWRDKGLNNKADAGDYAEITRRIQGTSTDAYESRLNYFNKLRESIELRQLSGGLTKVKVPLFDALPEESKKAVLASAKKNEPLYYNKNKKVTDPADGFFRPANVSLGEAVSASYDEMRYLSTIGGKERLMQEELSKAIDSVAKAIDPKDRSLLEALKKDPSLEGFDTVMNVIKQSNPDIKLPISSSLDIEKIASARAQKIEADYNNQHYGSFSYSPVEALKAGLMYGASAIGMLGGLITDPASAAISLYGPTKLKQGAKILPQIGKIFGIGTGLFGAEQVIVQQNRAELGVGSGFQQGVTNTLLQSGLTTAAASVPYGLGKLWKYGSKKYADLVKKEAVQLAKAADDVIKAVDPEAAVFIKRQAEDAAAVASKYERNPYGTDYKAKVKFENAIRSVAEDFIADRPVRLVAPPTQPVSLKMTKTEASFIAKTLSPTAEGETIAASMLKVAKDDIQTYFDRSFTTAMPENISRVPVLKEGMPQFFDTKADALQAFMAMEGRSTFDRPDVFISQDSVSGKFYITRQADIVDGESPRFAMESEKAVLPDGKLLSGAEDDLAVARQYPELTKAVKEEALDFSPERPELAETIPTRLSKQAEALRTSLEKDPIDSSPFPSDAVESAFERMETVYPPEIIKMLKEEPDFNELIEEIADLKKLKQPEVLECFTGVMANVVSD